MTESKPAPIDFYFEFASPYGYFAALEIDDLAGRHGRTVTWRPFLLGAALKITNMTPFPNTPLRGDYFRRDVPRCGRRLGRPVVMPATMPMNGLAATRAFYWLAERDPGLARALALAVYRGHWEGGRDMSAIDAVAEVAAPLGVDPARLSEALQDPAVKERARRETDAAIAAGVFGSPFMIVDGEPFWGHDRLGDVERWLETGGW